MMYKRYNSHKIQQRSKLNFTPKWYKIFLKGNNITFTCDIKTTLNINKFNFPTIIKDDSLHLPLTLIVDGKVKLKWYKKRKKYNNQ